MLNITYPELLHLYHRSEKPVPRQVVEPSAGVWGQTTSQHNAHAQRKVDSENADFYSIFSKAMERRAG